jgi:hypothetical protein
MEPSILKRFPEGTSDQEKFMQLCRGYIKNNLYDYSNEDYFNGVKYLVEHGADVNMPDDMGTTGLIVAVYSGNIEIVRFLCERGADVNAQDNLGRTPMNIAMYELLFTIIKILCEHGVKRESIEEALDTAREMQVQATSQDEDYPVVLDDIVEYLETKLVVPQVTVERPAVNEKMNSMPNSWKEDNLEDMTCPVCMGLFYKPLTFSCGHSLCSPCFDRIPGNKPCPECRKEIGSEKPAVSIVIQKHCDRMREYVQKQVGGKGKRKTNARKTKKKSKVNAKVKTKSRARREA